MIGWEERLFLYEVGHETSVRSAESLCCVQRKTHKRKPKMEATSAHEAFEKMVQERKLSKKINYDVLKNIDPLSFKADATEFPPVRYFGLTFIGAELQCFLYSATSGGDTVFTAIRLSVCLFFVASSQSVMWNSHSLSRTNLRSQTMSTQKITSSTGRRWQLSAGNLIGQQGGSERLSKSGNKPKMSWAETRGSFCSPVSTTTY